MDKPKSLDKSLLEAAHLQALEGNPFNAADFAMFEMFKRENSSPDERRAYILAQIGQVDADDE